MLIRTNIYLPKQTANFLKRKAEAERTSMAEIVRKILDKEIKKAQVNWAQSLLSLVKRAGKSGIGDLARKHDKYLYPNK